MQTERNFLNKSMVIPPSKYEILAWCYNRRARDSRLLRTFNFVKTGQNNQTRKVLHLKGRYKAQEDMIGDANSRSTLLECI